MINSGMMYTDAQMRQNSIFYIIYTKMPSWYIRSVISTHRSSLLELTSICLKF